MVQYDFTNKELGRNELIRIDLNSIRNDLILELFETNNKIHIIDKYLMKAYLLCREQNTDVT